MVVSQASTPFLTRGERQEVASKTLLGASGEGRARGEKGRESKNGSAVQRGGEKQTEKKSERVDKREDKYKSMRDREER